MTELVFILDRSGSMSGLEADTIGGFNSMLRKQQKEDCGEALVSTILFDDVSEVHLLEELPDHSRAWGTGTDRFSMGSYHFKGYGNGKAMIDHEAEYFLLVKRKNEKWFGFSVTDSEEMLKLYERLKVENP